MNKKYYVIFFPPMQQKKSARKQSSFPKEIESARKQKHLCYYAIPETNIFPAQWKTEFVLFFSWKLLESARKKTQII